MNRVPRLFALNVGRGDSFFLEIPVNSKKAVVLIDGGDDFIAEKVSPLGFCQHKQWRQIDLMILTHIHPDHLIGLLDVADHVDIIEAVLPYPPLPDTTGSYQHPKAKQTADMLSCYARLFEKLRAQHTLIRIRPPFGEQTEWEFGNYRLRHLDPADRSPLPAFDILQRVEVLSEEALREFDALSNFDSSVWLLQDEVSGEHLILFGGDAPLANWQRLLGREKLCPQAFKVSHHGMKDALNVQLLKKLSPQWILITNRADEMAKYKTFWSDIAQSAGTRFVVTGEPETWYWVADLPAPPERAKRS